MTRLPQNLKRHNMVTIAGIFLVGTAAIASTIHYSEPQPLSDDEIVRVHSAIHAVALGDISNLKLNRDGSVTAFITSGLYSKQTVVATKVSEKWKASVTMEYF